MSFFKKSNGQDAAKDATGENELGGFTIIPDKTTILAAFKSADIEPANSYHDGRISIKWDVLKPSEYQGLVTKQNIKCFSKKESERDKALDMLAAIDKNAGGKLAAAGVEPTHESLNRALTGSVMLLEMAVMTSDDGTKNNWVRKVSPRSQQSAPVAQPLTASQIAEIDDSDIPF